MNAPQTIYLKDYTPPAYLVDTVDLDVAIQDGFARISTRLSLRRNPAGALDFARNHNGIEIGSSQ